jgi:hypothetical protein
VRRYLLVLDMDLLALDEELDLAPINYLLAQQEQQPWSFFSAHKLESFPWRYSRIMTSVLTLSIA